MRTKQRYVFTLEIEYDGEARKPTARQLKNRAQKSLSESPFLPPLKLTLFGPRGRVRQNNIRLKVETVGKGIQ